MTLMKSYWPRTAHCAFTVAPSCSTSRFTSRIREGLFLMVCTPSGVSVESMMYVGTASLLLDVVKGHLYHGQRCQSCAPRHGGSREALRSAPPLRRAGRA